ncbi:unnamed protein product [Pleuronectes platessa]|uniref:Uncharacterized protein n=1 Tax=Pleuronectes platessa TaxID=8262 RepID=A0A9N7YAM6_PLEPL|nr:unnamed protein product [Pleuronectes platessa]
MNSCTTFTTSPSPPPPPPPPSPSITTITSPPHPSPPAPPLLQHLLSILSVSVVITSSCLCFSSRQEEEEEEEEGSADTSAALSLHSTEQAPVCGTIHPSHPDAAPRMSGLALRGSGRVGADALAPRRRRRRRAGRCSCSAPSHSYPNILQRLRLEVSPSCSLVPPSRIQSVQSVQTVQPPPPTPPRPLPLPSMHHTHFVEAGQAAGRHTVDLTQTEGGLTDQD